MLSAYSNASGAMQAMSSGLATISQNISNVNTTGYKSSQTQFQSVLKESFSASDGGGGGVDAYNRNTITSQGSLVSTNESTDLAITGSGFFMVATPGSNGGVPISANANASASVYYTRSGAFSQQAVGDKDYFTTSGGQYLLGWMADNTGTVDTGSLVPVYTQPTQAMKGVATTAETVGANIPASATATPSSRTSTAAVTDDTGAQQTLTLSWTRLDAQTWTVTATGVTGGTLGLDTNSYTVTTDANGNVISPSPASADFSVTWADGTAANPAVDLGQQAVATSLQTVATSVWDGQNTSHTLNLEFEKSDSGSWYLSFQTPESSQAETSTATVTDADGNQTGLTLTWTPEGGDSYTVAPSVASGGDTASGSATVTMSNGVITSINGNPVDASNPTAQGFFTVDAASGDSTQPTVDLAASIPQFAAVTSAPVAVAFNGDGTIAGIGGAAGSYTATADVTWANGQTSTVTVDLSGLTQYAGTQVQQNGTTQNGYADGMLQSAAFDASGNYVGTFSNGKTLTLFQIPLADFVSDNSLEAVNGTLFQRTQGAGALTIQAADGSSGGTTITGGSLESSDVDLNGEMTTMILAQKAYSTNSQVFKVVDEMTTTARDLIT